MGELSNQLKKYLEETPKEIQEQHFFEIACKIQNIDPSSPNAKRLLWWKQFKEKFLYTFLPVFIFVVRLFFMVATFMLTGIGIITLNYLVVIIASILGAYLLIKLLYSVKELWWIF